MSPSPLSHILQSLIPRTAEELSLLKSLLSCVRAMHRRMYADLGIGHLDGSPLTTLAVGYSPPQDLVGSLPAGEKRYFDGLLEAFEIYHSIYHQALPIETLSSQDPSLAELRRIRDLCLEGGLHSVY